jgi:hypothetical protein
MSHHSHHSRATRILPHHRFQHSLGAPLLRVAATITHVFPSPDHHHGANHQHLNIVVKEVISLEGADFAPETLVGTEIFVAVRFGDNIGLDSEVPGLEVDQPIEIQGEYISSAEAYKTQDNSGTPPLAVLHFTHHPVGYVSYQGQYYS